MNRREFLRVAGLTGVGLLASGCTSEDLRRILEPTATGTPRRTDKPSASRTPGAIATKEATKGIPKSTETSVPKEVALSGILLDQKVLMGFSGIGGEEVLPAVGSDSAIGGGAEQETFDDFFKRISENWKLYLANPLQYADLGNESMRGDMARLMAINTAASGFDRSTIDLTGRFPALKDSKENPLRVLPFQIKKVNDGSGKEEVAGWPSGSVIRDGTNITINGRFVDDKGQDQYLVSYTEYLQRPSGEPALVPLFNWLTVGKEQFETLIGEANRDLPVGTSGLVLAGNKVHFTDGKTNYAWEINTIDKKLIDTVKATSGFPLRVDMIGGELAEKPVVPSPAGFDLPKDYGTTVDQQTGEISVYAIENGVKAAKPALTATYDAEQKVWVWATPGAERPSWLPTVSNAEAKYNPDKKVWEYYSTSAGEKGAYVVSVRENNGSYEFNNFAEILVPELHSELSVTATWEEMAQRMQETGAVKALFAKIENVAKLVVTRFNGKPLALALYLKNFPAEIYYPYLKESQANPSSPRKIIYFENINPEINLPLEFIVFSSKPSAETMRIIEDDENLTGEGIIANLGQPLLRLKSGIVEIDGRKEYDDDYNQMLLDSFVRDEQGRLMHP